MLASESSAMSVQLCYKSPVIVGQLQNSSNSHLNITKPLLVPVVKIKEK